MNKGNKVIPGQSHLMKTNTHIAAALVQTEAYARLTTTGLGGNTSESRSPVSNKNWR
jgi:hypothetical protein